MYTFIIDQIHDQVFQEIQKSVFLAYFPQFCGQKIIIIKNFSCYPQLLTPQQNLEKNNDTIPKKPYRTPLATASGPMMLSFRIANRPVISSPLLIEIC